MSNLYGLRRALAGLSLVLAPLPALAAEGGRSYSLMGSFLQMLASLAVIIGVIFLFSHLANRWMRTVGGGGVPRYIRLVETRHVGPKKSLMLVEVGGEYLLLGNSPEGVQFIKQVDMLEEIEVVGTPEPSGVESARGEKFRELLAKVPGEALRPFTVAKKGVIS